MRQTIPGKSISVNIITIWNMVFHAIKQSAEQEKSCRVSGVSSRPETEHGHLILLVQKSDSSHDENICEQRCGSWLAMAFPFMRWVAMRVTGLIVVAFDCCSPENRLNRR